MTAYVNTLQQRFGVEHATVQIETGSCAALVAEADLDGEVQRLADRILTRSGAAIAIGKRTFCAQLDSVLSGAFEIAVAAMVSNLARGDAAEGIDAFLTKRPPQWRNA